jgi:hypothetical protein
MMPDVLPKGKTWKYALIGGLFSIPLSLSNYWISGLGSEFSTSMVFFGGFLAGYLAKKNSANPARAGVGAGVVGGLPGYIWILPAMIQTATAWSSPMARAVLMVFMGIAVITIAALPGLIGGFVGGWLAKKLDRNRAAAVSA